MHVILFTCWLEINHCLVTLSWLPCALFCSCRCKVRSQITLCFLFGSKDKITVFTCLPSCTALHCRHTFVGGILTAKNTMAASHVVQIHTHARFLQSKKWMPLCTKKQVRAAAYILTWNALIQYSPQFEHELKSEPKNKDTSTHSVC